MAVRSALATHYFYLDQTQISDEPGKLVRKIAPSGPILPMSRVRTSNPTGF